jgi:hypothetical protein
MIVKKHLRDGRLIVAVCDKDILGKVFEEGERILDLTSDFYKGEERTEEETIPLLKEAFTIDFVGDKSVDMAIKKGFIDEANIIRIQDVPHAQCLFLEQ